MISEGSCETEDWSNNDKKSDLYPRNKLHKKMIILTLSFIIISVFVRLLYIVNCNYICFQTPQRTQGSSSVLKEISWKGLLSIWPAAATPTLPCRTMPGTKWTVVSPGPKALRKISPFLACVPIMPDSTTVPRGMCSAWGHRPLFLL